MALLNECLQGSQPNGFDNKSSCWRAEREREEVEEGSCSLWFVCVLLQLPLEKVLFVGSDVLSGQTQKQT